MITNLLPGHHFRQSGHENMTGALGTVLVPVHLDGFSCRTPSYRIRAARCATSRDAAMLPKAIRRRQLDTRALTGQDYGSHAGWQLVTRLWNGDRRSATPAARLASDADANSAPERHSGADECTFAIIASKYQASRRCPPRAGTGRSGFVLRNTQRDRDAGGSLHPLPQRCPRSCS